MSELVTKAVGLVDAVESDEPNGAFEVVLSAPTLDRDREVIDARAFDPLPDHVPFDIDHSMTVTGTVGSGTPYYSEDGTLRVKGTFASTPLAQEVRTLVAEGHIRTTSVTFMSADRVKDEKGILHVKSAELLNGTFCPVPSNRQAVVLSAKSLTEALKDRRVVPDSVKTIIGSLEAARERVADAVEDTYPDKYTYVRGVLPDYVVFDVYDPAEGDSETWKQSYTDDGSVASLTGDPVQVDVMEVVQPDADAARDSDDSLKSASDAAGDADRKSASPAAEDADQIRAVLGLSIIENAARFAFGS